MPFDMPLGERKIVVLPVVGSNFQMWPASIAPLLVARHVREGDVAEVDHAVGRDGDAFGQHVRREELLELRSGGTIGSSADAASGKQANNQSAAIRHGRGYDVTVKLLGEKGRFVRRASAAIRTMTRVNFKWRGQPNQNNGHGPRRRWVMPTSSTQRREGRKDRRGLLHLPLCDLRGLCRLCVFQWALSAVAASTLCCSVASADDSGLELFEKKIRPLLVEHCYECHAAGAKKLGGKLLLDHRAGVLKGGETGPAIVPGKPEKSLLIAAVKYSDDASHMPPSGKLPDTAIADLEAWIKLGAPIRGRRRPIQLPLPTPGRRSSPTRRKLWSLQPVQKPAVPTPKNADWSADPIDRFVLAKLEERGLLPAQQADSRTLARRLSLVLTGLPPRDGDAELPADAYVDKLLASPHFGERWARHWMDLVRFTETHGNEWNYEVHHAWRYRDYLIRAFNDDVPYDQFVREHIAGDLLPQPRINQAERFNESVIGTAFYRFGEVNHDDCISLRQIGYDILDNQIDTLTKAFQATTVACARCHDHKLDAVSMHDYYALLGVLRSSRLVSHTTDLPDASAAELARLAELKSQIRSELAKVWLAESSQFAAYLQAAYAKRAGAANAEELAKNLECRASGKMGCCLGGR